MGIYPILNNQNFLLLIISPLISFVDILFYSIGLSMMQGKSQLNHVYVNFVKYIILKIKSFYSQVSLMMKRDYTNINQIIIKKLIFVLYVIKIKG